MGEGVLIAGLGNVFLADEGFGVEVVHRLARRTLPEGVVAADFGIRSRELAQALGEGWQGAVLVVAMARGGRAGALYVVDPDADDAQLAGLDGVLGLARMLGEPPPALRIVGCEPGSLEEESGLSDAVADVVEEAAALALSLAEELLA